MMNTPRSPIKTFGARTSLALLGAVSVIALGAIAAPHLVAQNAQTGLSSAAYQTSGIPLGDDAYGPVEQGALAPVSVGPAQGNEVATARRSGAVGSGRWRTSFTPFASASVTYSDNINLNAKGFEEDDTVLTGTVGATFAAESARLSGQLSYSASYDTYINDTNDDGFRHNLDTNWSAAIVPNLLYLDAAGGIAEVYIDDNDRFSGNPTAGSNDRSRAFYGVISPSLRQNLGGVANAELRYTLRGDTYDDDNLDGSYSHTYRAGLTSDPRAFRRFGWSVATEYEDITLEDDDGLDRNRWTSLASIDVPVSQTAALTGTVGYDHFANDTVDDDLSGLFANAGVRWQPSPRLNGQVYAGWRYDGFDYGANINYAVSESTVGTLNAGRTVQFTDYGGADFQTFGITDAQGNQGFIGADGTFTTDINDALAQNLLTGETGRFGDTNFALQEDDEAIVDTIAATLGWRRGNTGLGASVTAVKRDYGSSLIEDEVVIAGDLSLSQQLTNRLAAEAGLGYSRLDLDETDDGDFDTLSLGAGLTYQLTEIVNVFGRYTYTRRFADQNLDEFQENAAVIGLRASF